MVPLKKATDAVLAYFKSQNTQSLQMTWPNSPIACCKVETHGERLVREVIPGLLLERGPQPAETSENPKTISSEDVDEDRDKGACAA